MEKRKSLSFLWIFLTVNFIFCDVFSLMYSADLKQILEGKIGDVALTQHFLLIFAIIMEIPMLMILGSRFLKYKINRILNIFATVFLIIIQLGSLVVDSCTLHYYFISMIEIGTCIIIFWIALRWKNDINPIK
jgi:hypothetical protein